MARRFTPTGVGTIPARYSLRRARAVHPHGRGDNKRVVLGDDINRGSPPRAWGQSFLDYSFTLTTRFTPTGVGTMSPPSRPKRRVAVHPHGRGDNERYMPGAFVGVGSPPRAWGQFAAAREAVAAGRFTPTGVGTIGDRRRARGDSTVHPHGRGDNHCGAGFVCQQFGSPPRAWGQYPLTRLVIPYPRFTPTGVGTIALLASVRSPLSVHPHGRGDNDHQSPSPSSASGSPPRAWGQWPIELWQPCWRRFTPTGVGTIDARCADHTYSAVHPHGRGDN